MATRSRDGVVEWSPDQRFGRFDKVKGEGSSKTVYEACDAETGNMVAWNVVPVARLSEGDRARVADEIATLSRMHHERLMSVIATWSREDAIVFITAIIDSGDLRSFYKKHHAKLRIIKKWCRQILSGLSYLHEHSPPLVHRDIKCENILLNTADSTVRISDLGLCTTGMSEEASACGAPAAAFGGTYNYMAPEAFDGHIDWSVDIYAFGLTLCELVTRELPYKDCNFCQIFAKSRSGVLPDSFYRIKYPSIQDFIRHCVTVDPETGYRPTARALLSHPFLDETQHPQEDEMDDLVWPGLPIKDVAPTSSSGDPLSGNAVEHGSGSHAAFEQLLGGERSGAVLSAPFDVEVGSTLAASLIGASVPPPPLLPVPLDPVATPEDGLVASVQQLPVGESPMVSDRSIGTHPSASPSITESGAVTSSIDDSDDVVGMQLRGHRRSSGASVDVMLVRHETAARIEQEAPRMFMETSRGALREGHTNSYRESMAGDATPMEYSTAADERVDGEEDGPLATGRSLSSAGDEEQMHASRSRHGSYSDMPNRTQHRHGVSILGPGDVSAAIASFMDAVHDFEPGHALRDTVDSFDGPAHVDLGDGASDGEERRVVGGTAGSELMDVVNRESRSHTLGFDDGRGSALPDHDDEAENQGGSSILERARELADPDHADESAFDRREHLQEEGTSMEHHAHSISSFDPHAAIAEEQAGTWSLDDSDAAAAATSINVLSTSTSAAQLDDAELHPATDGYYRDGDVTDIQDATRGAHGAAAAAFDASYHASDDVGSIATATILEPPRDIDVEGYPVSDQVAVAQDPSLSAGNSNSASVRTLTLQIDHDYQAGGTIASQASITFDFDVASTDVNTFAQELVQSLIDQGTISVDMTAVPMFAAFLATQRFLPQVTLHVGPLPKWNWHRLQLGASDSMQEPQASTSAALRAAAPASPGLHSTNFMSPALYTQSRAQVAPHKHVPELQLDAVSEAASAQAAAFPLPSAAGTSSGSLASSATSRTHTRRLSTLSRSGTVRFDVAVSSPRSLHVADGPSHHRSPHAPHPQSSPAMSDLTETSPYIVDAATAILSPAMSDARDASGNPSPAQSTIARLGFVDGSSPGSSERTSPTRVMVDVGAPSIVTMEEMLSPSDGERSPMRPVRVGHAASTGRSASVADSFASPPFSVASTAPSPPGAVDNFLGSPPPVTVPYPHRADHAALTHASPSGRADGFTVVSRQGSLEDVPNGTDVSSPGVEVRVAAMLSSSSAAELHSDAADDVTPHVAPTKDTSPSTGPGARISTTGRVATVAARGVSDGAASATPSDTSHVHAPAAGPTIKPRDHELDSAILSNLQALDLSNASGALRGGKSGDSTATSATLSSGMTAKASSARPQLPIGSMSSASMGAMGQSPVSAGLPALPRTGTYATSAPALTTPTSMAAMSTMQAAMHHSQAPGREFAFPTSQSYNMAFLPTPTPAGHFPAVLPPAVPMVHTPTGAHLPVSWSAPPVMMMPVTPGVGMHQFAPPTRGSALPTGMSMPPLQQYHNGSLQFPMSAMPPLMSAPSCALPGVMPMLPKVPLAGGGDFDPFRSSSSMISAPIGTPPTVSVATSVNGLSMR